MKILLGKEAEKFLRGLPVARSFLVKKQKDAINFGRKLGYPLVLKIISKQAIHKTDIGGVKIVKSPEELNESFNELLKIVKRKRIKLDGIMVQEYVKGQELIIGINRDDTFGHVLMFGLGGILVEAIRDVTFRVCPISFKDAEQMIQDLKFKKILLGFRGGKPVNLNLLKKVLVKVSKIPLKHKEIEELDINPFILNDRKGKIVDVRIITR